MIKRLMNLFPDIKSLSDFDDGRPPLSVWAELGESIGDAIKSHAEDNFIYSEYYPAYYQLLSGEFPLNVEEKNYIVGLSVVKTNTTRFSSNSSRTPYTISGHEEVRKHFPSPELLYPTDHGNNEGVYEELTPESLLITVFTRSSFTGNLQSASVEYEDLFSYMNLWEEGGEFMSALTYVVSVLFSQMKDEDKL